MPLEARGVGYRYSDGPWVLRGVDISLDAGEVVGLMGPSGCGKSTLGRILAGYCRAEEGEALLDGAPLPEEGYSPVQLVFQHPEKAVNPAWLMRRTLNEAGSIDGKIVSALGIEPAWLNRWPRELSGGELQRFCVARALGGKTRYLIADEMTTMLDAITQAQIWRAVLDTAQARRMGILVISHEPELLNRLCTRVIDINKLNRLGR